MLCNSCQHVRLPHVAEEARRSWRLPDHACLIRHHACFDDLIASAAAGCELCQAFRPFVEHAKARAQGAAERAESDCSATESLGYTHEDPFRFIDRGQSIPSEDGRGRGVRFEDVPKQKYYVRPGCYYEEDSDDDQYRYQEDEDDWNARRTTDMGNQIDAEDKAYEEELQERLARLGLRSAPGDANGESEATKDPVQHFHQRMLARKAETYEEVQWALSTTAHHTGPEQLWITLTHYHEEGELETSAADDMCLVTLTAGSCDPDFLDDGPDLCVNGIFGYTRYSLATLYPGIWKYKSNRLTLPQKRPGRDWRPMFEFYQRRDNTFPTSPRIQSREVGLDPTASGVVQLARSWLSRCIESHERCKLQQEVPVPTRLIAVGENDAQPNVRLHVVNTDEKHVRYATLSHCWGPDQDSLTKLRENDLAMFRKNIPMESLAQNFQDAITITRSLGIPFLWIDALCICQDSKDDWATESSKIAEYYRGSEVTIVALSSSYAGGGILKPRPTMPSPIPIQVEEGTLYLRLLLPDAVSVTDSYGSWIRKPVAAQPLSKRAWTLQERLFSRRLLYFTEEQLIWQCRSRFFAEDGQYSLGRKGGTEMAERDIVDILNYRPRIVGEEKRQLDPSVRTTQWYSLVKAYSQRRLTYDTDTLPGISGLAREVSQVTKTRYVAGLWIGTSKLNLVTSLLWNPVRDSWRSDQSKPDPRRAKNKCPTWSWASIIAEIEHPLADETSMVWNAELDAAYVAAGANTSAANPFGEVKGGRLVLKCWTYPYRGVETYNHLLDQAYNRYDWGQEYGDKTSDDPKSPSADPFAIFDLTPPENLWDPDDPESAKRTFKLAYIVYVNDFEEDKLLDHAQQYFLLLEYKTYREHGWFVRAGRATTESGNLFTIGEEQGWTRENVKIF